MGRFGTGFDLESHALRDWTRSKSWEEVTPGAPTGAAASKPEISNSRHRRARLAGLGDKELSYWSKADPALLFFAFFIRQFCGN